MPVTWVIVAAVVVLLAVLAARAVLVVPQGQAVAWGWRWRGPRRADGTGNFLSGHL